MPYWQLFYHLIWSTKSREPLLTPDVEKEIYGFLVAKATGLGAVVYALDGTEDHVHLVTSIPPSIAVSRFVGQIKAVASTRFNKAQRGDTVFAWQAEYGAFSFDGKRLGNVIAYVEKQKRHHADGTIIPVLERLTATRSEPKALQEQPGIYASLEDGWLADMMGLSAQSGLIE
jgi:putative transposase